MNLDTVEQVVALLDTHGVSEIDVEIGGERVHARRTFVSLPASIESLADAPTEAITDASVPAEPAVPATFTLFAPMVGVFHHATPPVSVGTTVQAGQRIGAIEAMKLMNDVKADDGGRVVDVLAEDGGPVEYGQPLLRLQRLAPPPPILGE